MQKTDKKMSYQPKQDIRVGDSVVVVKVCDKNGTVDRSLLTKTKLSLLIGKHARVLRICTGLVSGLKTYSLDCENSVVFYRNEIARDGAPNVFQP